jgi:hypothetical protein
LAIQAKSVVSGRIVFNPFGVRFGVRLPISDFHLFHVLQVLNLDRYRQLSARRHFAIFC